MTLLALDRADWALITALVSVVVAVVSLGWTIFAALRLDRPHVKVQVGFGLLGLPGAPEAVIVTATNDGRRATTLTFLAVTVVNPGRWYRRWSRRYRNRRPGSIIAPNAALVPPPTLPAVLDVGQSINTVYPIQQVRNAAVNGRSHMQGLANLPLESRKSRLHRVP